jgi:hypothetical protein
MPTISPGLGVGAAIFAPGGDAFGPGVARAPALALTGAGIEGYDADMSTFTVHPPTIEARARRAGATDPLVATPAITT